MNKKLVTIIVVLLAVCALVGWCASKYNMLVSGEENVSAQWAQVENAYQRRADLIPNLVETVKGYATHEENTLTEVVEARSKVSQIVVDPSNLTQDALTEYQSAQNGLSSALSRLLVIRESYPELKADAMFLELQAQLEGTENRINVARDKFNDTAKEFNTSLRQFPTNIVASLFHFETKPYFKADESAATAPKVSF